MRVKHDPKCTKISKILLSLYPKIKKIAKISKKNKRETGFSICRLPNGKIKSSQICSGKKCSISLSICRNSKLIGSIHVHPSGVEEFSAADISGSIIEGEEFSCTMTPRGKITCVIIEKKSKEYRALKELLREDYEMQLSAGVDPKDLGETDIEDIPHKGLVKKVIKRGCIFNFEV